MKSNAFSSVSCPVPLLIVGTLGLALTWPLAGAAQNQRPDPTQHQHPGKSADASKDLAAQVRALQAKIARLEAALNQGHKGTSAGMPDAGGMAGMPMGMMGLSSREGMDRDQMMSMMQQMMGGMKGMEGRMPGMMDMGMMGGKGMQMMGGMKGMGGMSMPSALPGFPGASHIYHVGATGFFLDHPEHLQLTTQQQANLNRIKEKALLEQASIQRKIDEAEQEVWTLTASDQPDAAKIEAKVRAIEKLRGDQRLAFIRAVGEAAKVLTEEQRQALLGHTKPQAHPHTALPSK